MNFGMSVSDMLLEVANICDEGFWVLYLANQLLAKREGDRPSRTQMLVEFLGYVVLITGFNLIQLTSPYVAFALIVCVMIVMSIFWNGDLSGNIVIVGIYFVLLLLGTLVKMGAFRGTINGDILISEMTRIQEVYRITFCFVVGIIWFVFNWAVNYFLNHNIGYKKYMIFVSVMGIGGSVYLINTMLDMFDESVNILIVVLLALFSVACYGVSFKVKYKSLVQKQQIEFERNVVMEEKYQQLTTYYEDKKKLYHDMNSHFRAILELAENDKNESVVQYIRDSQQLLSQTQIKRWTGVDIVDSILTEQIGAAKEMGVEVTTDIEIIPMDTYIKNAELCSIFSNLLKNCLEAKPTKIKISVKVAGEILVIRTENDYEKAPKKDKGHYKTSKEKPEEHGLGLRIMEEIAERYGGTVTYQDEDGMFGVSILINLP